MSFNFGVSGNIVAVWRILFVNNEKQEVEVNYRLLLQQNSNSNGPPLINVQDICYRKALNKKQMSVL